MGGEFVQLPVEQRLRAGRQSLHFRSHELLGGVLADLDHEIAHFQALFAQRVALRVQLIGIGSWKRAPHGLQFRDRADLFLGLLFRLFEQRPDHREVLGADLRVAGDRRQSGIGFTEERTVFVAPGSFEVSGVVGGLPQVEIDDALDGVAVAVGLDEHGVRREIEPIGSEHHVVAHRARGL